MAASLNSFGTLSQNILGGGFAEKFWHFIAPETTYTLADGDEFVHPLRSSTTKIFRRALSLRSNALRTGKTKTRKEKQQWCEEEERKVDNTVCI